MVKKCLLQKIKPNKKFYKMHYKNLSYKDKLINNFHTKKSKVCIIGLGYVGLPLALCFAKGGYKVTGIDIDIEKIKTLKKCKSYLNHVPSSEISKYIENKRFLPTNDFSQSNDQDALILCVPTPLNIYKEPDLSYIKNTMNSIKSYLRKGQIISLESTSYPGTTEEIIKPIVENLNLKIGEEFFIVYSPEREDPGNDKFSTNNIPKVIGGISGNCLQVGINLYKNAISELVPVSSTKVAEMTKLLENIHRAVNIGLINELKILSDQMGIDLYEVIEAASTKPFGFIPYYPGPGLGGHCIPIDPFYFTWKAKEYGANTKFIELASEINSYMPKYVVLKISETLNKLFKSLKGSKILILGLSYKKNIDDMRESPSIEIIDLLQTRGAEVCFSDPYFKSFPKIRKNLAQPKSIALNPENIKKFDITVLLTDHDQFDYEMIKENSIFIVDTRGKYKNGEKIIRA